MVSLTKQSLPQPITQALNRLNEWEQKAHTNPLQNKIDTLRQKLQDDSLSMAKRLEAAKETVKYDQWFKMAPGAESAFFNNFEQVEFLFKSRLIFSIAGQRNCSSDEKLQHQHDIRVSTKGLKILTCNEKGHRTHLVSVANLMKRGLHRVEERDRLEDSEGVAWNYFKDGLQKIDRWEGSGFVPVAKISKSEQQALLVHAKKFWNQPAQSEYETSRIENKNTDRDTCVVQVFMCPRKALDGAIGSTELLHAAIRLVDSKGQVYSTGFGSTTSEDKYNEGLKNFLTSINGTPTLLDYEEFRPDKGRVTVSLSVTAEQLDKIVENLASYREKTIRFNILRQNCTRLATNVLHWAGVNVDNRANMIAMACSQVLPAFVHRVAKRVSAVYNRIPKPIRFVLELPMIVPKLLYIGLVNLFFLMFGSVKGSPTAPKAEKKPSKEEKEHDLKHFKHALQAVKPLDDPLKVYHSTALMRWMLAQPTTRVADYKDKPDMRLHPDQHNPEKLAKLQRVFRVDCEERDTAVEDMAREPIIRNA